MGAYIPVLIATQAAAQVALVEKAVLEHFRAAGATTPDQTVPLPDFDRRVSKRTLDTWMQAGVIRSGAGGYWLDEAAYAVRQREQAAHAKKAVLAIVIALMLVLVVVLVVWWVRPIGFPAQ